MSPLTAVTISDPRNDPLATSDLAPVGQAFFGWPGLWYRAKDSDGHFVRLKLWNIGSVPAIVEDVVSTEVANDSLTACRTSTGVCAHRSLHL